MWNLASHQHPPARSRRSKTLIMSKDFSWDKASMVMAPAGPAPMTATRLIGATGMIRKCCISLDEQSGET